MARQGYAMAELDHLLPRAKYQEFADRSENFVLSCRTCNGVKSDFDPLNGETISAEFSLSQSRAKLLQKTRSVISERMLNYNQDWRQATKILHSIWWEHGNHDETG